MITGSLPERVTYWCKGPCQLRIDEDDDDNLSTVRAKPAFCSDTENTKTMATAETWARGYGTWDNKINDYVYIPGHRVDLDNEPRIGYKVVGMERRAQNGRVYKCVDAQGHYFDMPMEILLDIMTHSEIKNSEIMCPLVWCRVASQMKLVRYKSPLYEAVVESTKAKKAGPIKDLIVGTTYETKNGSIFTYLGKGEHKGKRGQVWFEIWNFFHNDVVHYFNVNVSQGYDCDNMCHYIDITKAKAVVKIADVQVPVSYKDIENFYKKKNNLNDAEFLTLKIEGA